MERSIQASRTIHVAFRRASALLLDDPAAVFTEAHTVGEGRDRAISMDMGVALGAGASVHQDVVVELGAPRSRDEVLVLPMEWHANGHERVLPTFAGQLEVSESNQDTRLRLTGAYTVPLGVVGRFGDGVVGRRLARGSLDALVGRLAARLEAAVHGQLDSTGAPRTPQPVGSNEHGHHPEIYIG